MVGRCWHNQQLVTPSGRNGPSGKNVHNKVGVKQQSATMVGQVGRLWVVSGKGVVRGKYTSVATQRTALPTPSQVVTSAE